MMENLNQQLMHGLYLLLSSKPVSFIFAHSLILGFISGVISLMPFLVKRAIHAVIVVVTTLTSFFVIEQLGLKMTELFYTDKAYFIVNLVGNYLIGCISGFVLANIIQRIRGEHDHVANN